MSIEIRPVSPVLGAEITGINLADGIDDHTFGVVHQAFLDHGVVFFRDQEPLPHEVQVAFAERFGPPHRHPAAPTAEAHSAIFVIHAHRDSRVANGNGWHSDVSCDEKPPMATMLQLVQLPEGGGGDTLFASMEAAYAALPEAERQQLHGLDAVHDSEHVYRGRYADRGVDDEGAVYPRSVHPVIRTHPETGRPSIFVNRSFTTAIEGMPDEEGLALLRNLLHHIERPEFQIRFRWNVNDIALWDNRCLQHFAIWDYWPNERKGHRVSIEGDRPFQDPDKLEPAATGIRMSKGRLV